MGKAGIPSPPLPFVAIQPCRLVDTRPSQGFPAAWGAPALIANATRDFDLNSAPHCPGIPANAEAYSLNVTVTETQGAGDVRLWPAGLPPLVVSTQNWPAALVTLANAAIVPAGTGGAVTVQVAGSGTHLIIDINGYFGGAVTEVQQRVTGSCAPGSSIRAISATGSVICEADDSGGASAWSLTGNAGSNPATNFLGTTDNQALVLRVNGQTAFRLEPGAVPNVVGGSSANQVVPGVSGATISGGGNAGSENRVTDSEGSVGGGRGNRAGDDAGTVFDRFGATVSGGIGNVASGLLSTVGGGTANTATGELSTVSGGSSNSASLQYAVVGGGTDNVAGGNGSTVGGGNGNSASSFYSTVAGGTNNLASGFGATVPGGNANVASLTYSFAAGYRAKALALGAFAWADSSDFDFVENVPNRFGVRAVGGARFVSAIDVAGAATAGVELAAGGNAWAPLSDRGAKENFCDVDEQNLLERLAAIPIETWNLMSQSPSIRHIGPMAQDFAAAFGVGEYENHITTSDADGVAFAAIQALYTKLQERDRRIEALERRLSALEKSR